MNSYLDVTNGVNKITNLGVKNVNGLFEMIRGVIVHEVACQACEKTDGKLTDTDIYIPCIGVLTAKFGKKDQVTYSFKPDKTFADSLNKAVTTGESELLKKAESSMIEKIRERYESLL